MAKLNRVLVWNENNGIPSITHLDSEDMLIGESEDDFIIRYSEKLKKNPRFNNFRIIKRINIPSNKDQRNEWSLMGDKVKVDPVKVQKKQQRVAAREAVLQRLGVTRDQLREAMTDD